MRRSLRKLADATRQLAQIDGFTARRIAAEPNQFYGNGGTIHRTGDINIEIYCNEVVAVWYRCQRLPFTVTEVSTSRAEELANYGAVYQDPLPAIAGIELVR